MKSLVLDGPLAMREWMRVEAAKRRSWGTFYWSAEATQAGMAYFRLSMRKAGKRDERIARAQRLFLHHAQLFWLRGSV